MTTETPSFHGDESDILSPNWCRYTRVGQGDDVILIRCYRAGLRGHPFPRIHGHYLDDTRRAMPVRWSLGRDIRQALIESAR